MKKHDFDDHTLSIDLKKKGQLESIVDKFLKRAVGEMDEEEIQEDARKVKLLPVGTFVGVYYDKYHLGEVIDVNENERKVLIKYSPNNDEYWEDYPAVIEDDIRVISREDFESGVDLKRDEGEGEEKEEEKEEVGIEGRTMRNLYPDSDDSDEGEGDDDDVNLTHSWTSQSQQCVVEYHLSCMARGHGDVVWNSGSDISEFLVNEKGRARMFGEAVKFPLNRVLEFGAGAALPSLVCAKRGLGKVVTITDQFEDGVFKAIEMSVAKNTSPNTQVVVKAHSWGESEADLVQEGKYDLMIASDCIYYPGAHQALLTSASKCVIAGGIWVIGFSLHGNCKEEEILNFFAMAKAEGWALEREFKIEHDVQEAATWSSVPKRGDVFIKVLAKKK